MFAEQFFCVDSELPECKFLPVSFLVLLFLSLLYPWRLLKGSQHAWGFFFFVLKKKNMPDYISLPEALVVPTLLCEGKGGCDWVQFQKEVDLS